MLVASDISKSYSDRTLFSGLTFNVAAGDRIALIGPNGSGKTTLLDILAGEAASESGTITRRRNATMGYLRQEPESFAGTPLLQEVLDAGLEVKALTRDIAATQEALSTEVDSAQQADLLERLSQLEMALEAGGGTDREHEAKAILSGLGFKQRDFDRPMGEFSGGWAMRAGLARLLFRAPDVLLLDEPTNHLDLEANLWFEKYLASFKGGVLITSHDRAFLNQVATRVLAIEEDEVVFMKGNYDRYLVARERSLQVKQAAAARQEREIQRQMRFVERFRSKARKASQVQSRLKQIEKMETIKLPRATRKVHYTFPTAPRGGNEAIRLINVSKSYGDNVVYHGMDLTLFRGDRVALVGPNGAGKTTMLKLLAGVIPMDDGERTTGHNVMTAYYAQHVLELLNPGNTIIEELRQAAPGESEQNLRNTLGGFLFSGDDVRKPISVLSGGGKGACGPGQVAPPAEQHAAHGRADKPPRHRIEGDTRGCPRRLSGQHLLHYPRPDSNSAGRQQDRRDRSRPASRLPRRLRQLPVPETGRERRQRLRNIYQRDYHGTVRESHDQDVARTIVQL